MMRIRAPRSVNTTTKWRPKPSTPRARKRRSPRESGSGTGQRQIIFEDRYRVRKVDAVFRKIRQVLRLVPFVRHLP
jgi:hypothetical protein